MPGLDVPWHWVVLAIVVIALFGYKKLPDAARSLGRSMRIFKTEIKGMTDDDKAREATRVTHEPAVPKQITPVDASASVTAVPEPVGPVAAAVAPATPVATVPVAPVTTPGLPVSAPAGSANGTEPTP